MTKITIKEFLAWVQQQPNTAYAYGSPTACPLAQYVAASYPKPLIAMAGAANVAVYDGGNRLLDIEIDQRLNDVLIGGDQTFGSLANRLSKLL